MSKFKTTNDMATDIIEIKEKKEDKKENLSGEQKEIKKSKNGKHAGGRPNTRGEHKILNIAVPIEIYEKLKEVSNGNMTYYINSLLEDNLESIKKTQ